jgi:plastocyanin
MLIRMLALAAVGPLLLLAACSSSDDNATTTPKASQTTSASGGAAQPQAITVTAADFSLSPATITASAGQVINVSFKNDGNAKHSFTVGTTDVTEAAGGASASGSFTASATTVEFHCKYHSTMKGTITISGSSSSNGLGTTPPTASAAPAGVSGYGY